MKRLQLEWSQTHDIRHIVEEQGVIDAIEIDEKEICSCAEKFARVFLRRTVYEVIEVEYVGGEEKKLLIFADRWFLEKYRAYIKQDKKCV